MKHPYEYQFMVKYLTPIPISGMPDFGKEREQQIFTLELGKFARQISDFLDKYPEDGSWQVNSHSLTLADNTVIISILLQRPRQ
jgi:hypothetical protein